MELALVLVPCCGSEADTDPLSVLHRQRHFAAHPKSSLALFLYGRVGFSSFCSSLLNYFVLVVLELIVKMVFFSPFVSFAYFCCFNWIFF